MSATSSGQAAKIFINYRREDASGYAGRLYEWLGDHFGPDRVFMDTSAIEPGKDFVTTIETAVAACEVLIVIIGRQWLNCTADGQRRLDTTDDFVRLEISAALSRNILVIPVLIDGASMPREQDLPDNLKALARRHALELSNARWEFDVGRLIEILEERLGEEAGQRGASKRAQKAQPSPASLKSYWQLFPVRLFVGLLVLACALVAQFYFVSRPQPVNLQEVGGFSPATLHLGSEEITIIEPRTNSPEGLLLYHKGQDTEIVDVSLHHARLHGNTFLQFGKYNPPSDSARIDYLTEPAESMDSESCLTPVEIRFAEAQNPPAALSIFQLGPPGEDHYRHLNIKSKGQLLVKVDTSLPEDETNSGSGCRKRLSVGPSFSYPVGAGNTIAMIADADSAFSVRFNPSTAKNNLWDDAHPFIQPFTFGNERTKENEPAPFRASAVEISALVDNTTPILSAHSLKDELLVIETLEVGSDQIRIKVSGRGIVMVNGKDYIDYRDRIKKHPLITALLVVFNVALLVWFMRLLFKQS